MDNGAVLGGRYTLRERIGAGGMGVVWRATDARLDRQVAVKLLSVPAGLTEAERARFLGMFVREARAAAALESSYIVPVFDHSADGDTPYLVMPLLSGRTLRELLDTYGPMEPARAAETAAQVCRALVAAHRAGIVHRDIKPPNVMVTAEGTVKVLDFGVAKFVDARTGAGHLTATTDAPVGTLHYMAPERFTRGGDTGAGDLYSLGCTLYETLTGTTPFTGASAAVLMYSHVHEEVRRPSALRPGLGAVWDELLLRLLAKDPADRPDATAAATALDALARPAPEAAPATAATSYVLAPPRRTGPAPVRPARRRLWAAAAAAVAAGALAAALAVTQPWRDTGGSGAAGGGFDGAAGTVAPAAHPETLTEGTAADSRGPAPAVNGARRGGRVAVVESSLTTVDPGNAQAAGDVKLSQLAYRSLTGLKTLPDGTVRLVGDLADGPGAASDGGRTWTFRLKPGLRYDTGEPVRAGDFAHAVERTLDPAFSTDDDLMRRRLLGLSGAERMSGAELPSGAVGTPDDRTVVFRLAAPCADFGVALSGPSGVPVPRSWTGKPPSAQAPPTTGPYKITKADLSGGKGTVELARNPRWQPDSDPLRTAYPDRFTVESTGDASTAGKTLLSLAESGVPVMTFTGGPLGRDSVPADARLRTLTAPAWYARSYFVNTRRLTDPAVRRAVATAIPAGQVLRASGVSGTVTHHLLPPGVVGSRGFDVFGAGDDGDPAAARALLDGAGRTGQKLTVAYRSDQFHGAAQAETVRQALKRAGFTVTLLAVAPEKFYQDTASYDVFGSEALTASLPVGSSLLPDYFSAHSAQGLGHVNWSRLADAGVDGAVDDADAAPDIRTAGARWAAVDRRVMEQAAAVPVYVPTLAFTVSKSLRGLQTDGYGVSALRACVQGG
ncbi:ABC transporter substrate-binding protein [Streptomyces andamanensis]|uniref:non-specific serine/threonine protein kinase n=1 Tax=Streptomyces andamanensis TaxID=1565035 RepID=A0ABV8TKA4_9ACTN